jgi:60 kDa SS-A/Ro ribonucleoprotein
MLASGQRALNGICRRSAPASYGPRTLAPFSPAVVDVVDRLTNGEAIVKGRIHPMDLYLALKTYASGRSQPNPAKPASTWSPVPAVLDALEEAYELSFGSVEPSAKRLLVPVDSSGSMDGTWGGGVVVGGSPLGSPYEIANTMAVMLARIERATGSSAV